MWPHSPAMALAPTSIGRPTTIPPPTPVPRMTPNTLAQPAAAPSLASDKAKQLASLASRTARPSAASRSRPNGRPFSQVELAFLTRPVRGDQRCRECRPRRSCRPRARLRSPRTSVADRGDRRRIVAGRRGHPAARLDRAVASIAAASILVPPRSMPMRNPADHGSARSRVSGSLFVLAKSFAAIAANKAAIYPRRRRRSLPNS